MGNQSRRILTRDHRVRAAITRDCAFWTTGGTLLLSCDVLSRMFIQSGGNEKSSLELTFLLRQLYPFAYLGPWKGPVILQSRSWGCMNVGEEGVHTKCANTMNALQIYHHYICDAQILQPLSTYSTSCL